MKALDSSPEFVMDAIAISVDSFCRKFVMYKTLRYKFGTAVKILFKDIFFSFSSGGHFL